MSWGRPPGPGTRANRLRKPNGGLRGGTGCPQPVPRRPSPSRVPKTEPVPPRIHLSLVDGGLVAHRTAVFSRVGAAGENAILDVDANRLVAAEGAGAVDEAMSLRREIGRA